MISYVVAPLVGFFKKLALQERSPKKLAISFCVGNFIAFSPFLFLHTTMVFFCAWFFRLNLMVMFCVSIAINNFWTLIPIHLTEYIFGYWISYSLFKFDFSWLNKIFIYMVSLLPTFVFNVLIWLFDKVNYFFEHTLGLTKPCFWSFLIGGNLLGIMTSLLLYPIMKRLFTKLTLEIHGKY